jgi:dihydrolipoyl dehydrogenase
VEAEHILVATGSKAAGLDCVGADHPRVIDSDGILALKRLPASVLVVGAGAIGCEWSSILAGLGCRVTLMTRRQHVLPREDPDIGSALGECLAAQGVDILTGTHVESISGTGGGTDGAVTALLEGDCARSLTVEYLLVAAGRLPLTDGLNLETIGVETEGPGWIKVDEYQRTNVPSVLAIGDVTGRSLFAHAAFRQALVAVEKLAGLSPQPTRVDRIPYVAYTRPEVAGVGLTEEQARAQGLAVTVAQAPNFTNARAVIKGHEEGFVKVVAEQGSGRLLGVHMIGIQAGELIPDAVSALEKGWTLEELAAVIRPHPALCESLGEACLTAAGRPLFSI